MMSVRSAASAVVGKAVAGLVVQTVHVVGLEAGFASLEAVLSAAESVAAQPVSC